MAPNTEQSETSTLEAVRLGYIIGRLDEQYLNASEACQRHRANGNHEDAETAYQTMEYLKATRKEAMNDTQTVNHLISNLIETFHTDDNT
jgi:hypothetical protein